VLIISSFDLILKTGIGGVHSLKRRHRIFTLQCYLQGFRRLWDFTGTVFGTFRGLQAGLHGLAI